MIGLAAKAVRRRKRAGKLTPVAVRRSLYADRWLPRYYVVIRRELDRMAREVAASARVGMPRDVARSRQMTWAERLIHAKERWVYAVAQEGWDLAGMELTYQAGKFKSAPLDGLWGKQIEVGLTPEDFLVAGKFEDIDLWVQMTSLAEVETEAKDLSAVWEAAEESRDEETGRAWTNKQIADEIHKKGLAKNIHRANLLARTGTIWAINEGAQQRYAAAGVPAMEWMTTVDDLACPWCLQMDGRVIRTGNVFWKRGSEFGVKIPGKGGKGMRLRSLNLPFEVQHPPLHPYTSDAQCSPS